MAEFYPSLTPVLLSKLPTTEEMLRVMVPLLEESETWTLGRIYEDKEFNVGIQGIFRNKTSKDNAMWNGRVSDHPKQAVGGFEQFWTGIGVHHTTTKQEYLDEFDQCKLLKRISEEQEIWTMHYTLSAPASNRLFTILIATRVETDPATGLRTGYILSTPVDVASDTELVKGEYNATRGTYSAAARIMEMPDGGINWRAITTSTPGGYVPQFIVDRLMPAKLAEDVTLYLGWLQKHPSGNSTST